MQTKFFIRKLHIDDKKRNGIFKAILILSPVISMFTVELLNFSDDYQIPRFGNMLWNVLWYIILYSFVAVLSGKKMNAGTAFTAVLIFIFAVTNHYVFRFRGRMLLPSDLMHLKTAANVASGYDYSPDFCLIATFIISAIHVSTLLKYEVKPDHVISSKLRLGVLVGLLCFTLVFFCSSLLPRLDIQPDSGQGENRGFLFNFMVSLHYCMLREPEDYSEELVDDLQEDIIQQIQKEELSEPEAEDHTMIAPTNILIIMNESLADFSIFDKFSSSKDPLEFIHSMNENTISGKLYSPVHGGGTANVEYEVLTGNLCSFLPDGAIAYQSYIDDLTPSLAWLAKEHGYSASAFHPFSSSSWNRTEAYDHLGFDRQLYEEDIEHPGYVRTYISDACNFRELERITEESDGRVFVFNVTMQNHGGYGLEWDDLPHSITLPDDLSEADPTAEQYFSLIDQTDKAFKELIEYYENCEEPTLIAMFGDHQPALSTEFYDVLYGNDMEERSAQDSLKQYATPFVIWTNYDIEEKTDINISANFFGIMLSDLIGFERTYYMEMVAQLLEELPVIHNFGYITADGKYIEELEQLSQKQQELIKNYEIMAYYDLFDRDIGDKFYEPEANGG